MAFNNSIELAQKYLPILDEVYKKASLTSVLDATAVDFTGANEVKIFSTSIDGLADYDRNAGYADGSVTGEWETFTLDQNRGRRFLIDALDDEETLNQAFGTLAGEFIRTRVVPELDAYRFAQYASKAGKVVEADLADDTNVASLIDDAEAYLGDAEVPEEGRFLFVSEKAYKLLKNNITRSTSYDEAGIAKTIETYDNMPVIRVPQGRFYTDISVDSDDGFENDGAKINFMIVSAIAPIQTVKHEVPKIIDPQSNQFADGWLFAYRIAHMADVKANKVNGIYVHAGEAATTETETETETTTDTQG